MNDGLIGIHDPEVQRLLNRLGGSIGAAVVYNGQEWTLATPTAAGQVLTAGSNLVPSWATAGGSSGPAIGLVTSDQTRNATTTLATVTGATTGAMTANVRYWMEVVIRNTCGHDTPGVKIGFSYPSGATIYWGPHYSSAGTEGLFPQPNSGFTFNTAALRETATHSMGLDNANDSVTYFAGIVTCGGTAGTLSLQGAQDASHASNTVFKVGTFIRLTPLE